MKKKSRNFKKSERFLKKDNKQLAEWLKELKTLREEYEIKCRILDNVPTDIVADIEEELGLHDD